MSNGALANAAITRSEERFSRNAETDIVCRLLLDKNGSASLAPGPARPADQLPAPPSPRARRAGAAAGRWGAGGARRRRLEGRGGVARFFFNDTAAPETYPLPPPDALPS